MTFSQSSAPSEMLQSVGAGAEESRGALALLVGLLAGLMAGGIWAGLVLVTGYEIGYVAWGIGLLVGYAMTRATRARGRGMALTAAALACFGLVVGKVLIFAGSTGSVAEEYLADEQAMRGVLAWQLYESRELGPATLEELDATITAGDTLSDAVWASMTSQAGERLASMSQEERTDIATAAARETIEDIGVVEGVRMQLGPFDLLWLFLAVSTAFRMLAQRDEPEPVPAAS